jgi:choloylglycine hydrolase
LVLGLCSADRAVACTTFCLQNGTDLVFGKNYDWNVEDGLVFVNKRNVQKTAMDGGDPAASWVSKYGSVTFNQFGREQPTAE